MCARIFMTLLKNAKNGQNAHHSIESTLLSQSLTVKGKFQWLWLDLESALLSMIALPGIVGLKVFSVLFDISNTFGLRASSCVV